VDAHAGLDIFNTHAQSKTATTGRGFTLAINRVC